MDLKSHIEELLEARLDLYDVIYILKSEGFDVFDIAKTFRRLDYFSVFRRITEDEGILEMSLKPCYGEGGEGYEIPLPILIPWPLEVE